MAPIENWLTAVNSGQSYTRMAGRRRRRRSATPQTLHNNVEQFDVHHVAVTA